MFLMELEGMAELDLAPKMKLEGMDLGEKITEAVTAYRSDFPEKDGQFSLLSDEVYGIDENGQAWCWNTCSFVKLIIFTFGPFPNIIFNTNQVQRSDVDSNGLTMADKQHIMNYLQLKLVILFLQKERYLGKYCFYGCWCFPHGTGEQGGYGAPVDNIDKSCREYTTCYNCIHSTHLVGHDNICTGSMNER